MKRFLAFATALFVAIGGVAAAQTAILSGEAHSQPIRART